MILYFGSFNPVHKGHIAMAEHVMDKDLGDEVAMIVSPQNPFKAEWMQAPEMDRLEMVERACRNSRHPDRIHPSVIEFLLEKPSYTVNTLRHLEQNYGSQMTFSILMGSDLVNQLPRWRDADEIISRYDLLVYPRPNEPVRFSTPRTTVLDDAPEYEYSSTRIRDGLEIGEDVSVDGRRRRASIYTRTRLVDVRIENSGANGRHRTYARRCAVVSGAWEVLFPPQRVGPGYQRFPPCRAACARE